jgi:hypothetical protein
VKERLRCIRLVDICITWWDRFSADSMALLDSFNYETSSFDLFHFVAKIIRSSTCHLVCMHNEKEIDFYSVLTHVYMLSLSVFFSRWRKKQTHFVFILTLLLYATINHHHSIVTVWRFSNESLVGSCTLLPSTKSMVKWT